MVLNFPGRPAHRQRRRGEEQAIPSTNATPAAERRDGLRDAAFIVLVTAACCAPYVLGLGYYSDDWWAYREPLALAADRSWGGLYAAVAQLPMAAVRPGQILWYVAFEKLAPGNATIVHLANNLVFGLSALLLLAGLRAIPALRRAAYYLVLIYVCLPTFSVAKMWYANHQAILALFFFSAALVLETRLPASQGRRRAPQLLLLALAAAACNLMYELFAGALLALPLFVAAANGASGRALLRQPRVIGDTAAIAAGLAATTLFKLSHRYGFEVPGNPSELVRFAREAAAMYLGAAKTTFWTLGLYSPRAALGIARSRYLQPWSLAAPLAVVLLAGLRERVAAERAGTADAASPSGRLLVVSGAVAFALGYVPYLFNFLYSPKPWGEGNRGNIAAALGAALLFYAAFRWLYRQAPALGYASLFVFCATGAFLQAAIGGTWVRASTEQERVYLDVRGVLRAHLPATGTVLLYGTCPYFGAGPVFPYGRDLAAKLAIEDGYRALQIGIVRPGMQIEADGLANPPGALTPSYPYAALRVLDLRDGSLNPVDGAEEARRYFTDRPLDRSISCPFEFGIGNPLYGTAPSP